MNFIKTSKLSDGVWQLAECDRSGNDLVDAYLVCGSERAVLIDALCTATGLYKQIRSITTLPLDVVLTHGHMDHAGASMAEFFGACRVFIDGRDVFLAESLSGTGTEPITDGQVFELGGRRLEAISVPGHTPGSIALFDRDNEILFTGDTIGSGNFWMQLPESLPLTVFLTDLERLAAIAEPYDKLAVYVGHRSQGSLQTTGMYIRDVLAVTRRITGGTLKGRKSVMKYGDAEINMRTARLRSMKNYCYDPEKITIGGSHA